MIKKNIVANVIGRAWTALAGFIFIPLYLKFLGIEAFGLVGFYTTLVLVLVVLDLGLTATLNREMARLSMLPDRREEQRNLLRTYEITYVAICSGLIALMWLLTPVIAEHWLHSSALQSSEIITALRIMSAAVGFQLLSGLFIGGLMGLQFQVRVNWLQALWGLGRGAGVVLVLWLVSPTIIAFAAWQLAANSVYCLAARANLWRQLRPLPGEASPRFRWQAFVGTWRYSAGMCGMTVVAMLLTQADKLALSKMQPLSVLGLYSIAVALASLPAMLVAPVAAAVFPRLTGLIVLQDRGALIWLYHRACGLVSIAILPTGLTAAVFAPELIRVWTGSEMVSQQVGLTASLLIAGQLLQAITMIPYYLALANGDVRLNLKVGVISLILMLPLLLFLITRYGMLGAGMSWLIVNICTLPPYMYALHRRFVPGELRAWLTRDVGYPLLAAAPVLALSRWLLPSLSSRLLTATAVMATAVLSTAVAACLCPVSRSEWNLTVRPLLSAALLVREAR